MNGIVKREVEPFEIVTQRSVLYAEKFIHKIVMIELNNGSKYFGRVTAIENGIIELTASNGIVDYIATIHVAVIGCR
jgi:hypothetical protein